MIHRHIVNVKKLLIIGNANVADDYAAFVHSCDVVVRINLRKNHNTIHGTTGQKTDILCYTPRAVHMVLNNDEDLECIKDYCKGVRRLWFLRPRHAYLVNRTFLAGFILRKERLFLDESRAFLKSFELKKTVPEFVGKDFLDAVIHKLCALNPSIKRPLPSAGILVIEKVLACADFDHYEKYLLGFTFEGWEGHPWELEKELVRGYLGKGRLRKIGDDDDTNLFPSAGPSQGV